MNIILFKDHNDLILQRNDERAKHIKKILKLDKGSTFTAGIIDEKLGIGKIEDIIDGNYHCSFCGKDEPAPLLPVTLICGLVRPITAKRLLKDISTMGIEKIIFVITENSEKSYKESNLWKNEDYKKYLIDGASQGVSTIIPEVKVEYSLKRALEQADKCNYKLCLDNVRNSKPISTYSDLPQKVTIAIGSERGWTENERDIFDDFNFDFATMGNRILRTESAVISALSIVLNNSSIW